MLFLALASLASAAPLHERWWNEECVGANYFQTNGFEGNQLVANYILPDGTLAPGSATWTNGNGSACINDPSPYENHPDPFTSSGSVIVSHGKIMVTNAGSNTFSVFSVGSDPGNPTLMGCYDSGGEFPNSLAASPDGSIVCALNGGAKNGFWCYDTSTWMMKDGWSAEFNLNLTTPPHGPVGGLPSQIIFANDMSSLIVVVKGKLPMDLNNPTGNLTHGTIMAYPITNGQLGATPTMSTAMLPFSINEDLDQAGTYYLSDVTTGFAGWDYMNGVASDVVQGVIPYQAAVCWAAQSNRTRNFYNIDIGTPSNITEVCFNDSTMNGTVMSQTPLGVNASGTDISIFYTNAVDWLYINAPGYMAVHVFAAYSPGSIEFLQAFNMSMMPQGTMGTKGFAGQAVWYKWM